jgi:O-antigen/teichoic acid export membrane protein
MERDFIKDFGKYSPSVILGAILGIIIVPFLTRFFPPEVYGNYVLVLTTVNFLSIINGWSSHAIYRYYPIYDSGNKFKEFSSVVIKLVFISTGVLSIFFLITIFVFSSRISKELYSLMKVGVLVFIILVPFTTLEGFLRAKREVLWYNFFSLWRVFIAYGFGVLMITVFNYGVESLLWGFVFSMILVLPILWRKSVGGFYLENSRNFIFLTSKIMKYGIPLTVGGISAWILSFSDRYILKIFWTSKEVGIYSASYLIAEKSILLIASLFSLADRPIAMRIWENKGEIKSKEFINRITRYYLIIAIPIVFWLSFLAKPLVEIMVSREYYQGFYIFPFVLSGLFLVGFANRFQLGLLFYKKTIFISISTIVSSVINIGLNLLVIPKYGYIGASITTFISYVIYFILNVIFVRKFFIWKFPLNTLIRCIISSILVSAIMLFLINRLNFSAIVNLILSILIGIFIYVICLFLFKEILPEEKKIIKDTCRKCLHRK